MTPEPYAERVAKMTLQDIADAEYAMELVPGAFNEERRALIRNRKLELLKDASSGKR